MHMGVEEIRMVFDLLYYFKIIFKLATHIIIYFILTECNLNLSYSVSVEDNEILEGLVVIFDLSLIKQDLAHLAH